MAPLSVLDQLTVTEHAFIVVEEVAVLIK